jgi:DnaJ-class molecular chaperone
LNPGKPEAEARFKSISAAYDLLSDPEKRARYDRGEIDESGAERPQRNYYRGYAEGAEGRRYQPEGEMNLSDLEDLFAAFGSAGRGRRGQGSEGLRARGADRHFTLTVNFVTAAIGGKQRLSLAPEEWLDVTIPPGIEDGQVLRLRGKGGPGFGGGAAGDALIEVHVEAHPLFRRDGDNILIELPVSPARRCSGPGPCADSHGSGDNVDPEGARHRQATRLRGKGIRKKRTGRRNVTPKVPVGDG